MKKEENEEAWDLRKILILGFFLVVGLLVALELKKTFLPNTNILGAATHREVVQVQKPDLKSPVNVQAEVNSKIEDLKNNVSNLNAAEVASSSPQIQKVLHDIQGLKDLPADQARQQCLKICSGL